MNKGLTNHKHTWIILALLMILGMGIRVSYLGYLKSIPGFTHPELDDLYHDYWARVIAFGTAEVPDNVEPPEIENHPYFRPPGYPYFLAAIYKVCGTNPITIRLVQHFIGVVSGFLLFRFVNRWFDTSIALVSAGLMLCTWFMIFYEGTLNAPVLLVPLIVLIIDQLSRLTVASKSGHALLAGILIGLYALVRPEILAFLPVAALWILWVTQIGWKVKPIGVKIAHPLTLIAIFMMGAALMIAPAALRNYRVSGEAVLVSVNGGINLFFGNNGESKGTAASHTSVGAWTCFDYPRLVRDMSAKAGKPLTYSDASEIFYHKAFTFIRDNPCQALTLTWRKLCLFWGPQEIAAENDIESERYQSSLLRNLPSRFSVILGLSMTGLAMFLMSTYTTSRTARLMSGSSASVSMHSNQQRQVVILMMLWVAVSSSTTILFFVSSRYRVPILPFLFVASGFALVNLWRLLTTTPTVQWAPWLLVACGAQLLAANNTYHQAPRPEAWHLNSAIACINSHQFVDAHKHLDSALSISPKNPEITYRMGSLLRMEGQIDTAIVFLQQTLTLDPNYLMAYIELGSIFAVQKQIEKATALFRKAVEISPGSAIANLCLGQAILDSGDADRAEPYFKHAFELDSRLVDGDHFLGSRAIQRRDYSAAETYFRHWLNAYPSNAMAHACLARALAPLGKRDEAILHLETACRLDPSIKDGLSTAKSMEHP
jgi:Flp pilus assembly protein TadD